LEGRQPNSHLVRDTWYRKVSHSQDPAVLDASEAVEAHVSENGIAHLNEASLLSFQSLVVHKIRRRLEEVAPKARLSPASTVLISMDEAAEKRALAVEEIHGACVVPLGSIASADDQTRFRIRMLPELAYLRFPPHVTADMAKRCAGTYHAVLFAPARVEDAVSGFVSEVHVQVGGIPIMDDSGSFIINSTSWHLVHRLQKSHGVRYTTTDKGVSAFLFGMYCGEMVSLEYMGGSVRAALFNGQSFPVQWLLMIMGMPVQEAQARARHPDALTGPHAESYDHAVDLLSTWFRKSRTATEGTLSQSRGFRLNASGRKRLNQRLGVGLPEDEEFVTATDILAASDLLVDYNTGKVAAPQFDPPDSLAHKFLRRNADVIDEALFTIFDEVVKDKGTFDITVNAAGGNAVIDAFSVHMLAKVCAFMRRSENLQITSDRNVLSLLNLSRKIAQTGTMKKAILERIKGIRMIHASHYGKICPIETADGKSTGLVLYLSSHARIAPGGEILSPHQRVIGGERQLGQPWQYLGAEAQSKARVAQFDTAHSPDGTLLAPVRPGSLGAEAAQVVTVTHLDGFESVPVGRLDYIGTGPPTSLAVSNIPFVEHDDANRAMMGAKMQCQALPTLWAQRPIVGTGFEVHVASCGGMRVSAGIAGTALHADSKAVVVAGSDVATRPVAREEDSFMKTRERATRRPPPPGWEEAALHIRTEFETQRLRDSVQGQASGLLCDRAVAAPGESFDAGSTLAESLAENGGETALGSNLLAAYMPWDGYNYEDAILISKRLVREDIMTSVTIDCVTQVLHEDVFLSSYLPGMREPLSHLENGVVRVGTWVEEEDVLIGVQIGGVPEKDPVTGKITTQNSTAGRMIGAVPSFDPKADKRMRYASRPKRSAVSGRVVDVSFVKGIGSVGDENLDELGVGDVSGVVIKVFIARTCRLEVGDKMAGRHGNKGIVARIVDDRDMPYLPDGTPIDICLNPLGVPSRMNVGQIYECLLGTAGRWLGQEYRVAPFDEMYSDEASRGLVFDALRRARDRTGYKWIFDEAHPGKTRLYDGRTGLPLDQPVTVGIAYILKLDHMVSQKMHTRYKGRYNQLTQQATHGKAQQGGMRLGEMEVSALIGYGAHANLQEMLTIKSDDVYGRAEARRALEAGEKISLPQGATSEGFLTFSRELKALGISLNTSADME